MPRTGIRGRDRSSEPARRSLTRRELAASARRRSRHRGGQRGARRGVAVLDRDENQSRGRSLAQLVDQQALHGRGPVRQERGQVGDVARARRDERRPSDGADQPAGRRASAPRAHGSGWARMVISERSPSASRMSTLRRSVARAVDADACDASASAASRGTSSSAQRCRSPRELDAEHALERGPVAGQRGADALDEGQDLRIALAVRHVSCDCRAACVEHVAVEHQALRSRLHACASRADRARRRSVRRRIRPGA